MTVSMNAAGALGGVLAGVTVALWSYPVLGLFAAILAVGFACLASLGPWRPATP